MLMPVTKKCDICGTIYDPIKPFYSGCDFNQGDDKVREVGLEIHFTVHQCDMNFHTSTWKDLCPECAVKLSDYLKKETNQLNQEVKGSEEKDETA